MYFISVKARYRYRLQLTSRAFATIKCVMFISEFQGKGSIHGISVSSEHGISVIDCICKLYKFSQLKSRILADNKPRKEISEDSQ